MVNDKERIELHCHSKAGGFSALYPGEIISFLSEMGMPAFAITDESNILAFTELEKVWETGSYSARPIYGMEATLKGSEDGKNSCISVLIKNEKGKENLYKIISKNESESPYPLYNPGAFLINREGLLLGSGAAKGKLYKLVLSGSSDGLLKDEISLYDYIELLPDEEYKERNTRLISLCDELNIPAVAVSDARYIDGLGKKALMVINHWNNKDNAISDCHFYTTEEMLKAFDYLPEEKAYEIVVENTHLIADMCETVSICPKECMYPVIPKADEKLRKLCLESFKEKYRDSKEAMARLDWELESIKKTDTAFYLLHMKELLDSASLTADDISIRGTASGSVVAYLLGISNVDPLKYDLKPETVFGKDGTRLIDIDINLPSNIRSEVLENVSKLEGISKYVWAGTTHMIADPVAQNMLERYLMDNDVIFDEETFKKLVWLISGNYVGKGKHPGSIVVFPDGVEYNKVIPTAHIQGGYETTYFDYHCINKGFFKYDLYGFPTLDILRELQEITGINIASVLYDDTDVLMLFDADADENVTGCADLPEFKSEYVRNLISILKPKTFDDLVKITGLAHGSNVWEDNAKILADENKIGIKEVIATRDDIYDYILRLGIEKDIAFDISEAVRKGIVSRGKNLKWQNWKKMLIDAGAEDWFIFSCEHIRYMFPKAHAISYLIMNMRLGWFKVHYPDEFSRVMKKNEELI